MAPGIGAIPLADAPSTLIRVVSWFGFGMLFLVAPFVGPVLFGRGPVIRLTDDGVEDARLALGLIPWRDIASISYYRTKNSPVIELWLRDERAYLARWSWWRRMLGHLSKAVNCSPFSITYTFLTPKFESAYEYMKQRCPERAPT